MEPISKEEWIETLKAGAACIAVLAGFVMACTYLAAQHQGFIQMAAQ